MQPEVTNPFLKMLILKSQKEATPQKTVQPVEAFHDLSQIEERVNTLRRIASETVVFSRS